ncbi:hypothetical protein [Cedecea sp. P7760]|uniref:hypothetical protein n=1 Tax=Cedecea sp. P7760 TaxID=2726983 RepID=UPI0015A1E547|nr:hypothetical protein [Cedecea sp. P7760]NWC63981.1 hypothetical protein [Cedecea sp. P7760]
MNIKKALEQRSGQFEGPLSDNDWPKFLTYVETILGELAKEPTLRAKASVELIHFVESVNSGSIAEIRTSLDDNDALIERLHGGNLPSTTGNPSGKGRGNAR